MTSLIHFASFSELGMPHDITDIKLAFQACAEQLK